MTDMPMQQLFKGFSKLNKHERLARLVEMGALTDDDVSLLTSKKSMSTDLAEHFIENVIGYHAMPLGVAANFCIDGCDYAIPMAVEETSIIAAASKTARWICQSGEITTESLGQLNIGQIQIAKVKDFAKLKNIIDKHKQQLITEANEHVAQGLVKRGGGVEDIMLRRVSRGENTGMSAGEMGVIHVLVNTCDAMGANIINQICEYLKGPIEELSGETVTMCILSNLSDTHLTRATVIVRGIDPELGKKIAEASLFAEQDPYRAATNNKGVLNGMDAVLLATGNDWRAVEAGIHAFAAHDGQYRSITKWRMSGIDLIGTLDAPIALGIVGGVTKLHPTAKISLRMLNVENSHHLARIVAAVGLVQNLGAIRALTTVGIIEGHMKLHIANLTLGAGAEAREIPMLQQRLEEILTLTKRVTMANAIDVLKEIRRTYNKTPSNDVVQYSVDASI